MGTEFTAGKVDVGASLTGQGTLYLALTQVKFDMRPRDFYSLLVKSSLNSSP
ncbi:unnamed protein product, partial [marine sediment metagenome]